MKIWIDGDLQEPGGLLDNGLHYGTGVFEGIRSYDTGNGAAIFRLPEHMDRFQKGADKLGMPIDRPALEQAMADLLQHNDLRNAYLRPLCFFGHGLHLDAHRLPTRQMVAVLPWTSHLGDGADDRGIELAISSLRRNHPDAIANLKLCGGYVNSVIAKHEAHQRGFQEALFLDGDEVVECTGENVFFIKDGEIISVDHPHQLPGITRATLIELTGATSRRATIQELLDADEVFLSGTSAEVAPVTRIEDRRYRIGARTREIQALYQDIVHGRERSRESWLTRIDGALAAK